jgi:hypothetical protein
MLGVFSFLGAVGQTWAPLGLSGLACTCLHLTLCEQLCTIGDGCRFRLAALLFPILVVGIRLAAQASLVTIYASRPSNRGSGQFSGERSAPAVEHGRPETWSARNMVGPKHGLPETLFCPPWVEWHGRQNCATGSGRCFEPKRRCETSPLARKSPRPCWRERLWDLEAG